MGGDYYDRAVDETDASGYTASHEAQFGQKTLHADLDPKDRTIGCDNGNPIVIALDVTGSMGDWAKIIFGKAPMLFGQIMMQGYLEDPAISFAAVGDANTDDAPLQICEFATGVDLDEQMTKMYLEGFGGGQNYETYELAAYYYARRCELSGGDKGFFFFTGDEGIYPAVLRRHVIDRIHTPDAADFPDFMLPTETVFAELRKKFHVFILRKPYEDPVTDARNHEMWEELVGGERVLMLQDAKSIVDVMLGAIAIVSGKRTLETYVEDMQDRDQSMERITQVSRTLEALASQPSREGASDAAGLPDRVSTLRETTKADTPSGSDAEKLRDQIGQLTMREDVEFPTRMICPITGEVFIDPVHTADGEVYERAAIEAWFESGMAVSPLTGSLLHTTELVADEPMREAVATFVAEHQ